ncbi:MAG: hypothetical protein R3D90_02535 [Paracoccaceae bacterium]
MNELSAAVTVLRENPVLAAKSGNAGVGVTITDPVEDQQYGHVGGGGAAGHAAGSGICRVHRAMRWWGQGRADRDRCVV